jgi:hypothetical protein
MFQSKAKWPPSKDFFCGGLDIDDLVQSMSGDHNPGEMVYLEDALNGLKL